MLLPRLSNPCSVKAYYVVLKVKGRGLVGIVVMNDDDGVDVLDHAGR